MNTTMQDTLIVGQPVLTGRQDYLEWSTHYDFLVMQLGMEKYAAPRTRIEDPAPNIEDERPTFKTANQMIQDLNQQRTQAYNATNAAWSELHPTAPPDDPSRPSPPAMAVLNDVKEDFFIQANEYELRMANWEILQRKNNQIMDWIRQTVERSLRHEAIFAALEQKNTTIQFLVEKLREICKPGIAREYYQSLQVARTASDRSTN